jgi:hypothetical protein
MKITERLYKILPATFPRFHITVERWKFNEQYKVWVSNQGNVLDENKNLIKRMTSNQKYMIFKIDGSLVQAHRLVLMTWQPRKDMDKLTVDHINSNPRDNRLCNLEWVTEEENCRRAQENHIYIHSAGPLKEKTEEFLAGKISVVAKSNKDIVITEQTFFKYFGLDVNANRERVAKRLIEACLTKKTYQGRKWKIKEGV